MTKIEDNTKQILALIAEKFETNQLNNDSLVQLIELAGSYLNIATLPAWAKDNGKSYNGAKMQKHQVKLFGVKFIIDNE